MIQVGLRIDVDTLRGTRRGVPALLRTLERHRIRASFFLSAGPDNMGRHLWRLLRPSFAAKMWRTGAASLYGWDILLRGTLWPGPIIAKRCRDEFAAIASAGHELGLHAWDHHRWQAHLKQMDYSAIASELRNGMEAIATSCGQAPTCSAAPGWICDERVLLEKERLPLNFNSDCRGTHAFRPRVGTELLSQPQIPTTLPTFDEAVGRERLSPDAWNTWLLAQLNPGALNVLTIHAEVEGIAYASLFDDFLLQAHARGVQFATLGALVPPSDALPEAHIVEGAIPGRDGLLALQGNPAARLQPKAGTR